MDEPANLMVVTGVLVFEAPIPFSRVRHIFESQLLQFPRFRQRIVEPLLPVGTPAWEEDPRFDLARHLSQVELAPPADEAVLQTFVASLMCRPFEADRPPWHFYFVPHYQGGSALIGRIHHAIGDGLALIHVILSMSDQAPTRRPPSPAAAADDELEPWEAVARKVRGLVDQTLALPASVLREAGQWLSNPMRALETTGQMAAGTGALTRLVVMPPDPVTRFKGRLTNRKRVVWSRPIPVADLKRVGRLTGSTINDVLMAGLSGALRRYLLERGDAVPATLDVRGVIPVNLRPIEEAYQLGNQFGLVFMALPLGLDDPLDRIFEVRRRMTALKRSPEAFVAFQILRAIGAAPRQIFEFAVGLFSSKATAVVTNVVGPREPISFAGVKMKQAMFWVPCAGRLGLGVSLLSYAGDVWLGVYTDATIVPDPERLLEGFYEEVDELLGLDAERGEPQPS